LVQPSQGKSQNCLAALIDAAENDEREGKWEEAVLKYRACSKECESDLKSYVKISIRLCECLELVAKTKDSSEDYRRTIQSAIDVCSQAKDTLSTTEYQAWSHAMEARNLYLQALLESEPAEQRRLLAKAQAEEEALLANGSLGEGVELLEERLQIFKLLYERSFYVAGSELTEFFSNAVDFGGKIYSDAKACGNIELLAKVSSFFLDILNFASDLLDRESIIVEIRRIRRQAEKVVSLVKNPYWQGELLASVLFAGQYAEKFDDEEREHLIQELLGISDSTRDRYLKGLICHVQVYLWRWKLMAEKDTEAAELILKKVESVFESCMRYLEHFTLASARIYSIQARADYLQTRSIFATSFVADRELRIQYLKEVVDDYHLWRKFALQIGDVGVTYYDYAGIQAMKNYALLCDGERRVTLLRECAQASAENVARMKSATPKFGWNIGVELISEATITHLLASEMLNSAERIKMLGRAVKLIKEGIDQTDSDTINMPNITAVNIRRAEHCIRLSNLLEELFELSRDERLVQDVMNALDGASSYFERIGRHERMAEVLWQKARFLGRVGLHHLSSLCYSSSAESYRRAATDNSRLKEFYQSMSVFMDAWSSVEAARDAHSSSSYSVAAEAYRRAAQQLSSSSDWAPLGVHYEGCALLEQGESLSSEEKPEEASSEFLKAVDIFSKSARNMLGWQIPLGEESEERQRWVDLTQGREFYSRTRAEIEQAKLLERRGQHAQSAKKYMAAAAALKSMAGSGERSDDNADLRLLSTLCMASAMMQEAEETGKEAKYLEAAELFEKVAAEGVDGRLVATARGNASFCRALHEGAKIRRSTDASLFVSVKRLLEEASDQYMKAALENATKLTRATESVFDGLVYMTNAEVEMDAKKREELYALAERSFQAAVDLYGLSGSTSKQKEIEMHLQHARERRRVFGPPTKLLDTSIIVESAQARIVPSLTRDRSTGLESLEYAEIQSSLIVSQKEVQIGEDIPLEVEMVNVGRGSALIVKVANLIPEGFEVSDKPDRYEVVGDGIDLRGRRLEPLKAEEVKLWLKAKKKGTYSLNPRIIFIDEGGKYRTHLTEQVQVTVKEMGVGSWLRGPS
jgi:hypothetical protein